MESFNGIILPNDERIPFPHPVSPKVIVQGITIRNHPAYNRKGDAKQLTAKADISKGEYLGSYGGHVRFTDANGEAEWGPYQSVADNTTNYYIDAEEIGNELRFINDAKGVGKKEPNIEFLQSRRRFHGYYITEVYATKDIKAGDELLVSYGENYWSALKQWYDEQNPLQCPNCEFRTKWPRTLRRHDCLGDKRKFECDYCDWVFKREDSLKEHLNLHTADKIYRCEECPFISLQVRSLNNHIQSEHAEDKWKCFECSMVLTSNSNLKKHILSIHTDEKPYICDQGQCEFRTALKSNLTIHINNVHLKLTKFDCDKCEYSTVSASDLKKHIDRVHNNKRPHICEVCNWGFVKPSELKIHVDRVHENNKPYKCQQCKGAFVRKSELRVHVERVHEKKRPVACDECDYDGSDKTATSRHKKRMHPSNDDE
jgi:hypothetical protein